MFVMLCDKFEMMLWRILALSVKCSYIIRDQLRPIWWKLRHIKDPATTDLQRAPRPSFSSAAGLAVTTMTTVTGISASSCPTMSSGVASPLSPSGHWCPTSGSRSRLSRSGARCSRRRRSGSTLSAMTLRGMAWSSMVGLTGLPHREFCFRSGLVGDGGEGTRLYVHFSLVTEFGRAPLWPDYDRANPPRRLHFRYRP